MRKVLVVGKNGYLSNCFKQYMSSKEDWKIDLITARDGKWKNMPFKEYDAVFNTVGLTHNNARAGSEEQFYQLNTELPFELAQKAKKEEVPIFVHMSSMIVYGDMSGIGKEQVITLETIPHPTSIYGRSKLEGEKKIQLLEDEKFHIAIIRSPLIYGKTATDNISRLINFAQKSPVFPNLKNKMSMIYDENLCNLVKIIIEKRCGGFYYPQQDIYVETSKFVKDIAKIANHKLWLTKIFNPILKMIGRKGNFIYKAFGNQVYDQIMSEAFEGKYRIVNYEESIYMIARLEESKNE